MSIAKLTDVRIFSSQREQIDKNGKSYITLVLIFCIPFFFLGHDSGEMEEGKKNKKLIELCACNVSC